MNITLGVYDLFAYAVPGSLYLALLGYIAERLRWVDPSRILHANTVLVVIAGLILSSTNSDYQQLANVVILVSLPIAGCTLAAGIAAGLADRKRPFSMLRLTGARLATLRRVVALEGAVPLLFVAAVAIGTGFAGAAMFASEAQQHPMVAPGAAYYLLVVAGIVVSLGIIAATFPLLARITGPEVARNE